MTPDHIQKSVDLFNQMAEAMERLSKIAKDLRKMSIGQMPPIENSQILAIQHAVCLHFNLPLSAMTSKDRRAPYVYARQIAMYLARQHTDAGMKEIAVAFGKGDHGTVAHGIRQIQNQIDTTPDTIREIAVIEQVLNLPPPFPPLYQPVHNSGTPALPCASMTSAQLWILMQSEPADWRIEMINVPDQNTPPCPSPS